MVLVQRHQIEVDLLTCDTALKLLTLSLSAKRFPGGSPTRGLLFVKILVGVKNPPDHSHAGCCCLALAVPVFLGNTCQTLKGSGKGCPEPTGLYLVTAVMEPQG